MVFMVKVCILHFIYHFLHTLSINNMFFFTSKRDIKLIYMKAHFKSEKSFLQLFRYCKLSDSPRLDGKNYFILLSGQRLPNTVKRCKVLLHDVKQLEPRPARPTSSFPLLDHTSLIPIQAQQWSGVWAYLNSFEVGW